MRDRVRTSPVRRAVCTIATGPHHELYDIARPALERFAALHGYEVVAVHHEVGGGRPSSWGKVALLRELLETYDQVAWIDADAVVVDPSADIFAGLDLHQPVGVVVHHYDGLEIPNFGVVALQRCRWTAHLLDRLWVADHFREHEWWENAALLELLGYDVARPRRETRRRTLTGFRVGELDQRWNSIPADPSPAPFIRHFPGMTQGQRVAAMRDAVAESEQRSASLPTPATGAVVVVAGPEVGERGRALLDRAYRRSALRRGRRGVVPAAPASDEVRREVRGLAAAHHETRLMAIDQQAAAERLERRLAEVEEELHEARVAGEILATSSFIRRSEVDPDVLVSVIMPTLDRRPFLERAIASVLAQTHQRFEIVVVDDGSTDDTEAFLSSIADPRLRVVRHPTNRGASAARNSGLDHATGELVVHLDSDNFFDPDWIRSVVWAFTGHPERHHLYGARVFDDHARAHDPAARGLPSVQLLTWDPDAVLEGNRVDMNVLAHRATPLRFDEGTYSFDDWDFLLQLSHLHGAPLRLPVIAAYYTTDAPDRMMNADPVRHQQNYERIRSRWAGTGA